MSYLDRNAVVKVPQLLQNEMHITFLEGEVRRRFSFGSNLHVNIIFQKYDQDWSKYVYLDSDVVLGDKEKLKMIVTPHIVTLSPTATFEVDSNID